VGSVNAYYQWSVSEKFVAASKAGDHANAGIYSSVMNDYSFWVGTAVNYAILWPIPVLVGAAAAWYIFKFLTRKFEVRQ
jgi:hypothetical protein